jgi:nucleotide-binding universal stress UspA family protein
MKHILLAIDRSAPSWEATRLAVHMAPKLNARVNVLSIVVPERTPKEAKDLSHREYATARELVDDVVNEFTVAGVRAKGEVRICDAQDVAGKILSAATRLETDLIVMGSRGRGKLTGILLGSVSHEVTIGARCPVIIVPTGATTTVTPQRIVLVIDGEGDPERPVDVTVELARALNAEVEVLCVDRTLDDDVETGHLPSVPNPDDEAVATAAAAIRKAGLEVSWRMIDNRRGFAPGVAREVMATGADIVVIGARARGWIGGDVAAGAAEAVLHRTHRPVVVAAARRRTIKVR